MSYAQAVYDILNADSALLAVLTGGVYSWKDLKGGDIDRTNTPDAYDVTTGLLLPIASVKQRGFVPNKALESGYDEGQFSSGNQTVEVWLYVDKDAGFGDLETAADLIYGQLQHRQISGAFDMEQANELQDYDPETGNCMMRLDFKVIGYRGST